MISIKEKFSVYQNKVSGKYYSKCAKYRYIHNCEDIQADYQWYSAEARKIGITSLKAAKELCDKARYTSSLESDNSVLQEKAR